MNKDDQNDKVAKSNGLTMFEWKLKLKVSLHKKIFKTLNDKIANFNSINKPMRITDFFKKENKWWK